MESKKIPNLNEDTIRRIVVEPKHEDTFRAIEKIVANLPDDKDKLLKSAVELLKKSLAYIDATKWEGAYQLGKDMEETDLEKQINEFLKKIEKL